MQYFNEYNSEVEYIKDLLRSTYIPTVRIFNSSTNIQPQPGYSSISYDTKTHEVVAQKVVNNIFKNETVILDDEVRVGREMTTLNDSLVTPDTRFIQKYKFGEWYKNYSSNFNSNKTYYDSSLHEWLGRYLRAYRDYYHIDVMNFYNCYSERNLSDFSLPIPVSPKKTLAKSLIFEENDGSKKITAFPILWDTEYKVKFYTGTISDMTLQAVYYDGDTVIGAAEYTGGTHEPIIHRVGGSSEFKITIGSKPTEEEIAGSETEEGILKYRCDRQWLLYLFIEYPSSLSCPIVVIEESKFTTSINNELLNLPDSNYRQVAFCDILLEYLTGAVISPATSIKENVYRVQKIVESEGFYKEYGVGGPNYVGLDLYRKGKGSPSTYKFPAGDFDDNLHRIIYYAFFNNDSSRVKLGMEEPVQNFIGFVDSDIEARLNKVASKYNLNIEV